MPLYKVYFESSVKCVTVEAKSEKDAREYSWDEYDLARDQVYDEGSDEVVISKVEKIK